MERRGTIELLLAMLICGTIGITVHLSNQDTISLLFFRCLFGAVTLFIICLISGYFNKQAFQLKMVIYSLLGGVALLINWYFLFSAYAKTSIGIATTVYNTQPLIMVIIGFFLFRESITRNDLFWMGISLTGLLFVSNIWQEWGNQPSDLKYITGIVEALIAALFYALATIFAKILKGTPPTLVALLQMLQGVLCLWPYANIALFLHPDHLSSSAATLLLGVLHTGIMYVLLYAALQKIAVYKAASISFVYPAIALLIDATALHVQVSRWQWIGIILILLGAAGINLKWAVMSCRRKNE